MPRAFTEVRGFGQQRDRARRVRLLWADHHGLARCRDHHPPYSQQQSTFGKQIPPSQVRPADLVFFAGADGTMTSPGHAGIVVGDGHMVDAPASGMNIQV